ncbi:hypothetical protein Tco_1406923 [Tanacetum coccineum]
MVKTGLVEAIDSLVPLDEHLATFRASSTNLKASGTNLKLAVLTPVVLSEQLEHSTVYSTVKQMRFCLQSTCTFIAVARYGSATRVPSFVLSRDAAWLALGDDVLENTSFVQVRTSEVMLAGVAVGIKMLNIAQETPSPLVFLKE